MSKDTWAPLCDDNPMNDVAEWIESGRIRTKPRTVDVDIHFDQEDQVIGFSLPNDADSQGAHHVARQTITLDEPA